MMSPRSLAHEFSGQEGALTWSRWSVLLATFSRRRKPSKSMASASAHQSPCSCPRHRFFEGQSSRKQLSSGVRLQHPTCMTGLKQRILNSILHLRGWQAVAQQRHLRAVGKR